MATTFIIGAGASADFGLPTGEQLIDRISETCAIMQTGDRRNFPRLMKDLLVQLEIASEKVLGEYGYGQADRSNQARQLFGKIGSSIWLSKSIDNYLNEQKRDELTSLGKLAIAATILFHEHFRLQPGDEQVSSEEKNPLFAGMSRGPQINFARLRRTWLIPFFRSFRGESDFEAFKKRAKNTNLIVFNYDRCVEHFLLNALMTFDGLTEEEAKEVISMIEIIHPYGSLGELPWQANKRGGIAYGGIDSASLAFERADSIRTFMESQNEKTTQRVRDAIKESKKLVFLGFGFARQNLELLGVSSDLTQASGFRREIFATAFGLTDYHKERAKRLLEPFLHADPKFSSYAANPFVGTERIKIMPTKCGDLINEFGHKFYS